MLKRVILVTILFVAVILFTFREVSAQHVGEVDPEYEIQFFVKGDDINEANREKIRKVLGDARTTIGSSVTGSGIQIFTLDFNR